MKPQSWQAVERQLKDHGAVLERSRGDHFIWRMPNGSAVVVSHPKHELPIGTLLNIYRSAVCDEKIGDRPTQIVQRQSLAAQLP